MGSVSHPTLALAAAILLAAGAASAGTAKGTLVHNGKTVTLAHAYLVVGPDALDEKTKIRRLILSANDLTAKLDACKVMSCTDGEVTEGIVVDISGGPRMNYWMAINDQKTQHSNTEEPSSLAATTDDAKKLAGKLTIDDTASGGPKVAVEFDAPLVKELTAAR
jgi:hypothetical protein